MDILFLSTELAPFERFGGLADVTLALAKTLRQLGHRVVVALPKSKGFTESGLLLARKLTPLKVETSRGETEIVVHDGRLSSMVEIVLLENDAFREPMTPAENDWSKYELFGRAVAELLKERAFDIVHVHDAPGSLVAPYVKAVAEGAARPKFVLTVHHHNSPDLTWNAKDHGLEGTSSWLSSVAPAYDAITAVGPTFAESITTAKVTGILNGIDYATWNPATDSLIASRYDAENNTAKGVCRGALLKEVGMAVGSTEPLVLSLGRISTAKGSDLLAASLPTLLKQSDARWVIGGSGDASIIASFQAVASASEGRVVFIENPSDDQVHHLFAGSDYFVMPSRTEPCGLTQQYAQRYGTVPVVRHVGGLRDCVTNCDADLRTGTGFSFEEDEAFVPAVLRALGHYGSTAFTTLVQRMMRLERSWDRPSRRYERIYKGLLPSVGSVEQIAQAR